MDEPGRSDPYFTETSRQDSHSHSRGAIASGLCKNLVPLHEEGQGMPGAGRTRRPRGLKRKVPTSRQVKPTRPAFPAQRLYGLLRALLGVPGLLAPVVCRLVIERLSTSVGVPGPRGLTVRDCTARLAAQPRPSHPAPTSRDDRYAPPMRHGTMRDITAVMIFGKRRVLRQINATC